MNKKWLKLASDMLEQYSDKLATNVCNDWNFPKDWKKADKQQLVKSMNEDNNTAHEYDPDYLDVPDWWVATFLSNELKRMSQQNIDK